MKKIILIFAFVLIYCTISAQIMTQKTNTQSIDKLIKLPNDIITDEIEMPYFDLTKRLEEDKKYGLSRFGYAFDVGYNLENSGTWIETNEGRAWTLKISSKDALSINLTFDEFYLPRGSKLFVVNEDKTSIQGAFTSKQNSPSNRFSTDLIQGSSILLVYFEPKGVENEAKLSLSKVVHGYKFLSIQGVGYGESGACNDVYDVNCGVGQNWQPQSNSVALIIAGEIYCSGVLLNTGLNDFTPYFLTADHCYEDPVLPSQYPQWANPPYYAPVQDWVFRFQYKNVTCQATTEPTSYISYSGASLVKRSEPWEGTDATLLKLNTRPDGKTGITYAGFSRSTTIPNSTVGIHHPKGDVMKIAFDNASPETNYHPTVLNFGWAAHEANNNLYWKVQYDQGMVEGASSGSPLFDTNGRIIGVLSGANVDGDGNGCAGTHEAWYGRLHETFDKWINDLPPALSLLLPMETDVVAIPYLDGSDAIMCNGSRTFTAGNTPNGSIVFWSHSNNLTDTKNGNQITVQPLANTSGLGWVQAFVTEGLGLTLRKEFWIGKPLISLGGSGGVDQYSRNTLNSINLSYIGSNNQGVTDVTWSYSGTVINAGGNEFNGWFATGSQLGPGSVTITATNACGTYTTTLYIEVVAEDIDCQICRTAVKTFPNPASDSFTFEIDKEKLPEHLKSKPIKLFLHNKMMTIKKEINMQGYSKIIDVSDLPADIYILQITIANSVFEDKIIVTD